MATERLIITVDEKGARVVKKRIESIGKGAKQAQSSVAFLQRTLIFLGAGLILRSTLRTLADFEQAMSTVKAVTGATEAQFVTLTERARELGATTRFTASQAAEGLVFLARSGFEVDEALTAVGDTLLLAQAGGLDLASASLIAASALKGFRLEADQAGRVVDVLTKTSTSAATNVFELGDAMKLVAPIAAGLGVSLEETAAALGVLSDNALRGTLAGTGLRRVLSTLETPGGAAEKIFDALGVSADEVRISTVGLTAAIERLAVAGLDTGQALAAFGLRGGPAFEVLRSSIPDVKELTVELNEAAGTAKNIADIMDDNLNGALLKVKSAFEAVILSFGATTTTGIQSFLLGLTNTLRFLASNIEILNGFLISLAVAVLPKVVLGLRALAVAIAGTGIGAIAVVLGTIVGLFISFRNQIRLSRDGVATLGDLAVAVFQKIRDIAVAAFSAIKNAIQGVSQFFQQNFSFLADIAQAFFGDFEFSIRGVAVFTARVIDRMTGLWRGLFAVIRLLISDLVEVFRVPLNAVLQVVGVAINGIIAGFRDLVNQLKDGVNLLLRALSAVVPGTIEPIKDLFVKAGIEIPVIAGVVIQAAADLGERYTTAFVDAATATPLSDSVADFFDDLEGDARERAAMLRETIAEGIPGAPGTAPVDGKPSAQISIIKATQDDLKEQLRLLRLTSAEREIQNTLLKLEEGIKGDLTDADRELLREQVKQLRTVEQVAVALDDVRGAEIDLKAAQEELNERLKEGSINTDEFTLALRNLREQADETDMSIGAGLRQGFRAIADEVSNLAGVTQNLLVNAFREAEDALIEFTRTGKLDFKSFADSVLEDLARLIIRQTLLNLAQGNFLAGLAGLAGIGGVGFLAGGGAGGIGGLLGLQQGGRARTGQPVLVGEGGPEIFSPDVGGRVTPLSQVPQAPPEVNIQILNVMDPNEVFSAMNTSQGQSTIINVIRRNRRSVQNVLR